MTPPLKVYFVIGEVSGDALGADLLDHLGELGCDVVPLGLGGEKMQARGLSPLFPSSEIAIMGISGVVRKLPSLIARARQTAEDIIAKKPDVVLLIDSPDFAKQVAKRVKTRLPDLPVVKYVCPTVWSWRPGRARRMKAYVDHVLAILPFEPEVMRELGGPETSYVGHPLSRLSGSVDLRTKAKPKSPANILLLPGSRRSEAVRLLPILEKSIEILEDRGQGARYFIPAVPHLETLIRDAVGSWKIQPEIILGEEDKLNAMQEADAAIAASGTAILELALYGVPTVSIYKLDAAVYAVRFLIKAWTAALPNLIADKVIVPERINDYARPGYIARLIEDLVRKGPQRQAQLDGFKLVHEKMRQDEPPGLISARIILKLAGRKT